MERPTPSSPPTYTLVSYPTLFRSHVGMSVEHQFHGACPDCRGGRFEEDGRAILTTACTTAREGSWICAASSTDARSPGHHLAAIALHLLQDRKSTRLNSSH